MCAIFALGDEDEEEDLPAEDMEVDYGSDDEEAVNDAIKVEDQETYNWREELRKLNFPEEKLSQYDALPIRCVSSIRSLPEWSAESDSPHPFVAARKAVIAMGAFDRAAYRSSAYWVGNEDVAKFFPIVLLSCLRRQESYIKKFMYKEQNALERVKMWMERAGTKFHFPCSGHITVGKYDGHDGYNFVGSFRSTSWNPSMLGTYVIPSTLITTRHWVSFCLSILAYICTVTNNPIEGDDSAIKPLFKAGGVLIPESEQEQINMLKEAIYVLYGKRGIRFFPPRPGHDVEEDEFVIPSFVSGSKGDWSSMHFVIALVDYSHVLSPEEKSVSNLLKRFMDKAQTKSLQGGTVSYQGAVTSAGGETKGTRRQLRLSARIERGECVDVSSLSSTHGHDRMDDTDSLPTPADVPHSWTPSAPAPSSTWTPTSQSWSSSGYTWEERNYWSNNEWTNQRLPKGQSKGSGSSQRSKPDNWKYTGW